MTTSQIVNTGTAPKKAAESYPLFQQNSSVILVNRGAEKCIRNNGRDGAKKASLLRSKAVDATGVFSGWKGRFVPYLRTHEGPVLIDEDNLTEVATTLGLTPEKLSDLTGVKPLDGFSEGFVQGVCDRTRELIDDLLEDTPSDELVDSFDEPIEEGKIRYVRDQWLADSMDNLDPTEIFAEYADTEDGGRAMVQTDWESAQRKHFLYAIGVDC